MARLPTLALFAGVGALGAYLAARVGGPLAGVLAAAGALCGAGLIVSIEPRSVSSEFASDVFDGVVFALPGAMVVYFAFNAGGYLPSAPAFAAIALALVLLLRVTLLDDPFAGFSAPLGVAVGALSLYAIWTLMSGGWSDAPARALIEFDRALLYLLALLLFGSIPRTSDRLRWVIRGLAVGMIVVATAALATRVFPDVFETPPDPIGPERLAHPIGYSNGVGIICMLGAILCLHIAASLREPAGIRVIAAAGLPILGATVVLTQSRGAVAAGAIGVVAYLLVGRPRALLPALIAVAPATLAAVLGALDADALTSRDFPSGPAVQQGHDLAAAVAICAMAAAALRLLLLPLDARLKRLSVSEEVRQVARFVSVVCLSLALVAAVFTGATDSISAKYDHFLHGEQSEAGGGRADTDVGDADTGGRIDYWEASLRGFEERPLRGHGAGTYEHLWGKERPAYFAGDWASDAHSLYVEVLGELGLVGLALLLTALVAIVASLTPLKRGRDRSLYAVLFAVAVAWAVHAGIDWNWELPATTLWLFAVGGLSLAVQHKGDEAPRRPTQGVRVIIGLVLLLTMVPSALLLASQHQLDDAYNAFNAGDCARTIDRATASISTLETRPEPYEAIAYCQVRRGNTGLAVQAMEGAVERDPENWKLHYGLALVRGAAGLDARPAARAARRLNPQSVLARELVRELRKGPKEELRLLTTNLARKERTLTLVP